VRAPVRVAVAGLLVLVALAATLPVWKPAAKRFKWFVVATNIYQDTLRRTGIRRDQISQPDYAALPPGAIPSYLSRINTTFADYEKYGGLTPPRVRGARVLEIGPGETLGVALRFIGSGAEQVVAADKFVPLETSRFHRDLYRELARGLSPEEQARVTNAVVLDDGVEFNPKRVQYLYGRGVEESSAELADESFDIVVSNAVLEEVYDLDRLFGAVDRLLKPGGRQVHVIDLGDYGMFSKHGFHPLEFLTIPDSVYRYMVEASGQPNRRPLDYYRAKMASLGYRTQIYRTWVLGQPAHLREYRTSLEYGRDYTDANVSLVQSVRGRLLPRYRQLSDDDLLTRSILLVADKPRSAIQSVTRRATAQ
jgi:SAM-dependent methyltransferase